MHQSQALFSGARADLRDLRVARLERLVDVRHQHLGDEVVQGGHLEVGVRRDGEAQADVALRPAVAGPRGPLAAAAALVGAGAAAAATAATDSAAAASALAVVAVGGVVVVLALLAALHQLSHPLLAEFGLPLGALGSRDGQGRGAHHAHDARLQLPAPLLVHTRASGDNAHGGGGGSRGGRGGRGGVAGEITRRAGGDDGGVLSRAQLPTAVVVVGRVAAVSVGVALATDLLGPCWRRGLGRGGGGGRGGGEAVGRRRGGQVVVVEVVVVVVARVENRRSARVTLRRLIVSLLASLRQQQLFLPAWPAATAATAAVASPRTALRRRRLRLLGRRRRPGRARGGRVGQRQERRRSQQVVLASVAVPLHRRRPHRPHRPPDAAAADGRGRVGHVRRRGAPVLEGAVDGGAGREVASPGGGPTGGAGRVVPRPRGEWQRRSGAARGAQQGAGGGGPAALTHEVPAVRGHGQGRRRGGRGRGGGHEAPGPVRGAAAAVLVLLLLLVVVVAVGGWREVRGRRAPVDVRGGRR